MNPIPGLLPHYRVDVDRATGDWLTTPEYLGADVDRDAHYNRHDTDAECYDIATMSDGCLPETFKFIAITVVWKDCMDSNTPLRPPPASVSAVAAAIIGQPDIRRWSAYGTVFSTAEMLLANAHDQAVIEWVRTAKAGDSFLGDLSHCTCLGESDRKPTIQSAPPSAPAYEIPQRYRADLLAYLEHHKPPGHFLRAVLCNDLARACAGSYDAVTNLPAFIDWLHAHAPAASWGTSERVKKWVASYDDGIPF